MSTTHNFVLSDRRPTRFGPRLAISVGLALVGTALVFLGLYLAPAAP